MSHDFCLVRTCYTHEVVRNADRGLDLVQEEGFLCHIKVQTRLEIPARKVGVSHLHAPSSVPVSIAEALMFLPWEMIIRQST